ncbi:MBL fold metallo-hydrolase [Saxibacter everestensis]|uniref:MBL fold metallo-hydrolase n=1 Tax=Saxibacter everestensis TaxID=2909229 RepID=A0ABY8QTW9_9MICO|nr:MBL fold metallo-hydrolase [Brevibacteriaceae bacterium ZFBP1038]
MELTRFGHAALLVEAAGVRVLIDPGNFSADETFDLDRLDAIAVTHQHPDHIDTERLPRLLEANPRARLLAEPQIAEQLRGSGELETAGDWEVLKPGDAVTLHNLTLTGVGGTHAVIHPDIPRVGNVGVLLTADGEPTLFHPGDSYEFCPAGVDILACPLGAPWAKVGETMDFVAAIAPRSLIPIHDRTIADVAYGMYWDRASTRPGRNGASIDARKLGQTESASFVLD